MLGLCWRLSDRRLRRSLTIVYILEITANVVVLFEPFLIGKIIQTIANGHDVLHRLAYWLICWLLLNVVFWSLFGSGRILEGRYAWRLREHLVTSLFEKVTNLRWHWHQNHHSGDTLGKMATAIGSVGEFAENQYLYLQLAMRMAGSVVALLLISPIDGIIVGFALPILTLLFTGFDKKLAGLHREQNKAEHFVNAGLYDYISNIATVLTLRLQAASSREIRNRYAHILPSRFRAITINETKYLCFGTFVRTLNGIALLTYVWQNRHQDMAILAGTAVMILQYLRQVSDSFIMAAGAFQALIRYSVNVGSIEEIETAYTEHGIATDIAAPDWHTAQASNITFRYEDQEHHTHRLDGVSLNLARGRRIALVGESGAGKSTLLRLLRGLHQPLGGTLTIDGAESGFATLAAGSTLVPQDAEIFENTLRYNITCGVAEDPARLQRAVDMAALQPVLDGLPLGLDTDIRERGVNLSGGQKQRLALARGLYAAADSSLLLLDEPTSSLDPATEAEVFNRLLAGFPEACIVASLHRLHLLDRFDHVYVMAEGKVVEEGSFAALLAAQGALYRLWQVQAKEQINS